MYRLLKKGAWLALVFFLAASGCRSAKFQGIQSADADDSLIEQIRRNPNRHKGKVIRVGGEIQGLRQVEWKTEIEFLELPLDQEIHPKLGVDGGKRYFVVFPERVDKFLYKKGKVMTVAGRVAGARVVDGEAYPLLEFQEAQVWNRLREDRFPSFGAVVGQF